MPLSPPRSSVRMVTGRGARIARHALVERLLLLLARESPGGPERAARCETGRCPRLRAAPRAAGRSSSPTLAVSLMRRPSRVSAGRSRMASRCSTATVLRRRARSYSVEQVLVGREVDRARRRRRRSPSRRHGPAADPRPRRSPPESRACARRSHRARSAPPCSETIAPTLSISSRAKSAGRSWSTTTTAPCCISREHVFAHAEQPLHHALPHVLDVPAALTEVRILDALESPAVGVQDVPQRARARSPSLRPPASSFATKPLSSRIWMWVWKTAAKSGPNRSPHVAACPRARAEPRGALAQVALLLLAILAAARSRHAPRSNGLPSRYTARWRCRAPWRCRATRRSAPPAAPLHLVGRGAPARAMRRDDRAALIVGRRHSREQLRVHHDRREELGAGLQQLDVRLVEARGSTRLMHDHADGDAPHDQRRGQQRLEALLAGLGEVRSCGCARRVARWPPARPARPPGPRAPRRSPSRRATDSLRVETDRGGQLQPARARIDP